MLNIAIDGPAGAGKSTVAKMIAKKLGILYLDTGAMYRAVAYHMLKKGISVRDAEAVVAELPSVEIDLKYIDGVQHIYCGGEDVSTKIREHAVSGAASDVSAIPEVRIKLVELQREIAEKNDLVVDGRDIGSYVLPNASCKFYLTASPDVRAKRRYDELLAKGQEQDYEKILADINQRDYNDSHRKFAPLVCVPDAHYVDSSEMTADEVCESMLKVIENGKVL